MDKDGENKRGDERDVIVNTGGGASISGSVDTGGGPFIGRDMHIHGPTLDEIAALMIKLKNEDQPKVWNGKNPYLGLSAFREEDAKLFFGRENIVDELLERLVDHSFMTIAGPSGSGKSSIARAGLLYALKQGRLNRSEHWLIATMTPGSNPIEQLAKAIDRLTTIPGTGDYIRQHGLKKPLALQEQIQPLLSDDPRQKFVLLVDQFEEIFSPAQDTTQRIAFIQLLTTIAQHISQQAKIVITLRSDFIAACADYPHLNDLINQQFYQVRTMSPADLSEAIIAPVYEVGAEIEDALVVHIQSEMKGAPGALPLMSFALNHLFTDVTSSKRAGDTVRLTSIAYRKTGGIESALQRQADQVFSQFSKSQQAIAKHIFLRLVDVTGSVDTRRSATIEELIPLDATESEVIFIIQKLTGEEIRLLTSDGSKNSAGDKLSSATISIVHEKLIDAWPWLRQLVNENRESIALENQLVKDAELWRQYNDSGYLYRGGRLLQIEERLLPNLTGLPKDFVQASQQQRKLEQEAEEEKRVQQEVKKRIQASQLATDSRLLSNHSLPKDPELALLLAVASMSKSIQPDTFSQLTNIIRESHYLATIYNCEGEIRSVEFSPDGQAILTASERDSVKLWDLNGQELLSLPQANQALFHPSGEAILTINKKEATLWSLTDNEPIVFSQDKTAYYATFSKDGQSILFYGIDEKAWLWHSEGKFLATLAGHDGSIITATFHPDGQIILTASKDGTARLWNKQGKELQKLAISKDKERVKSAVFSPDGQAVLLAAGREATLWEYQKVFGLKNCDQPASAFAMIPLSIRLYSVKLGKLFLLPAMIEKQNCGIEMGT